MSANNAPVIQTDNLSKIYKAGGEEVRALNRLNLRVQPGEIFGYLGPNGAGKTTTIRLLLDLIRPSEGRASILGYDVNAESVALHHRIGFLPGELNLWKGQTGEAVIKYLGRVRGMQDMRHADELVERLKLDTSKRVRDYSSGNKRKLGLVIAMMHQPDLLILDEPTGGLDPLMQQTFNQMMREIRDEGRTVFLSSHVLSEVQAICDRVGILRDGELKAVENVERLTHVGYRNVRMDFRDEINEAAWMDRLERVNGAENIRIEGKTVQLRLSGDFDPLIRSISDNYLVDMDIVEPSLEEIFLAFYGNGSDQSPQKSPPERQQERTLA